MTGVVRNGVRGTRDATHTSDSSLTGSSLGRLAEKLNGLKSRMRKVQGRSISDSDEDDQSETSASENTMTSNGSDSNDTRVQTKTEYIRYLRKQRSIPKGKQVMRDISGNTEVSSQTASASSDSEFDDSFDTHDPSNGDRRVQFSDVSIRTYSLVLGESQASKSYPISLDWAHTPTKTIDISLFELLYSASRKSASSAEPGKMVRGFRLPRRLRSAQRLALLSTVTGQEPEELYESNLARITRELEYIPPTACCSDDGFVELRDKAYQLIDSDEYIQVTI